MATVKIAPAKVQNFSVNSTPRYFDGQQGRFGDTFTYNISCYKVDLENTTEPPNVSSTLIDDLTAIRNNADFLDLKIKSQTIKFVKLIDFSFEEGDFSKHGLINLTLERYAEAKTNQIAGNLYDCFNQAVGDSRAQTYFENFSEDFTFDSSHNSTSYTYTLNILFREQAGDGAKMGVQLPVADVPRLGGPAIAYAKEFARNIFDCADRPAITTFGDVVTGLYQKGYKKTYTENYDLTSNTCSFSENFSTTNIEQGGGASPYALVTTQQSFREPNGMLTLSENGAIEGLGTHGQHDKYADALVGLGLELNNSTGRLQALFDRVSGVGDNPLARDCDDNLRIISTRTSKDPFGGTITYSLDTNNDQGSTCVCSGSVVIEDTLGTVGDYKEYGRSIKVEGWGVKITGEANPADDPETFGKLGISVSYPKFENARKMLLEAGTLPTKCYEEDYSLYQIMLDTWTPLCGPEDYSPWPIDESWAYNKNEGTIDVNLTWSENPIYELNARGTNPDGAKGNWIKSYEISSPQTDSVPRYNTFQGLNLGVYAKCDHVAEQPKMDQIMQSKAKYSPQGMEKTLSIVSVRAGDLSVFERQEGEAPPRLKQLMEVVEERICEENDYLIAGANYSYTPLNNCKFNYGVTYMDTAESEVKFKEANA